MEVENVKKMPAFSWLNVRNKINTFGAGNQFHEETEKINIKLMELKKEVKEAGYVPDTSYALHDTDEEQTEGNLWGHCQGRMNPPLPANYFSNCFTPFKAELKHGDPKSPDGFVKATAAIGEATKENMYSGNEILDVIEKWPAEIDKLEGRRQHWVMGSPRFDFYMADYGWGKPNKFELLSTEAGWSGAITVSVSKSRYFEGGLEIGLSKTAVQMNAFATVFNEVLGNLSGEIAFLVPRL